LQKYKRPNFNFRKLKMVVAELNAREKALNKREIGLEVTLPSRT
jgi:hypothetical protein